MAATIIGVVEIKMKGYPVNDKTDPHNRPPYERGVRTTRMVIKAASETDLEDWQDRIAMMEAYAQIIMDADI